MGHLRTALVVFGCGLFGIACSSAEEPETKADTEDRVVVDATSSTHEAIGIASWGISSTATSAVVHGYDAKHVRLVTFAYQVPTTGKGTFDATLDTPEGHATLRVDAATARVLEDSFADDGAAQTILARITADLRSQPSRFAGPASGLSTSSVHVLDLVQGASSLSTCSANLSTAAAATGAETTSTCSGGKNAGCSDSMKKSEKSQNGTGEKCECTGDAKAIAEAEVEITKTSAASGEEAARGYINTALDALCIKDQAARDNWMKGYVTLTQRESTWNPNAVNTTDSNATGPTAADGNPQKCSRGIAQAIPPTFAAHHQPSTSNNVYDPVASIAASMNYVISQYGVSRDGSNLAAKVRQADPGRGPQGY